MFFGLLGVFRGGCDLPASRLFTFPVPPDLRLNPAFSAPLFHGLFPGFDVLGAPGDFALPGFCGFFAAWLRPAAGALEKPGSVWEPAEA